MLGGLEAYASDDSDVETLPVPVKPVAKAAPTPAATEKKSSLVAALPPSSNALPKPKLKAKRAVFTVTKPTKGSDEESDESGRPVKKQKTEGRTGAGSSSLLAMLPAPSKSTPVPPPQPPKALGSGVQGTGTGLVFGFSSTEVGEEEGLHRESTEVKSTSLLPPSLAKGKAKASTGEIPKFNVPQVDFFSLGSSKAPYVTTTATPGSTSSSSSIAVSSAPAVVEFVPPEPTPMDPYPGYYQLPSGQWAAYDPVYYRNFWEQQAKAAVAPYTDASKEKGFEGAEGQDTIEIDAQAQLDLAQKEREEKKKLTEKAARGGPEAPRLKVTAAKSGSLARSRHQLHTLLSQAYENREALEEKIAQGKRNRKEAGNKYGF